MSVVVESYQKIAAFKPERFNPVGIAQSERVKAVLTCFEAGQWIPPHKPAVDMLLVVLEGEGVVTAGDREVNVQQGSMIFVESGEARGIRAKTRMVAIHVVTPPPSQADHAEVMARLQEKPRL